MDARSEIGPLIAIVGETASGKSQLAMELAQQFGGEIIAADAWTVYRKFDIGTAKPIPADQELVPHHLVDCIHPDEQFNVAAFKQLANSAINDIGGRGNLPLLVGGSGLYVDSVLFDYQFRQTTIRDSRNRLNNMTLDELLAEVQTLGISSEGVDLANSRRLIRLIETQGIPSKRSSLRKNTVVIGLSISREKLDERIMLRVKTMFDEGLVDEVTRLSRLYGWDIPAMQGVGYKEFRAYFEGAQTLEETKLLIAKNTRQLAKKQRTWFRRNKGIQWVTEKEQAVEIVTTFLNNYRR
jgi:tRNA dimethylallyltransferase